MTSEGGSSESDRRRSTSYDIEKFLIAFLLALLLLPLASPLRRSSRQKVPRIGFLELAPLSAQRPGVEAFRQGCASSAMSREKTLSLSTDMRTGSSIGSRARGRAGPSQG